MATMLPEGQVTATIYGLIKEEKFDDAILILAEFRQSFSKSRAALSLLAYCYYQVGDFAGAAEWYVRACSTCV